jgi:hypothetical protein
LQTLHRLGVPELADNSTVRAARSAAFFSGKRLVGRYSFAQSALCVSRYVLDAALCRRLRQLGGRIIEDERFTGSPVAGIVMATGRRLSATERGWRWFGLKAHASDIALIADLEMHLSENAYVGLCRLGNAEVNVCGLLRSRSGTTPPQNAIDLLRGTPGSELDARLRCAVFLPESFCAVAGLSLRPQAIAADECRMGDALSMIAPITGNGMSMALESAELATDPLVAYAREEQSWESALSRVADAFEKRFARRLRWAWRFHRLIFSRAGQYSVQWLLRFPPVWQRCFALTR